MTMGYCLMTKLELVESKGAKLERLTMDKQPMTSGLKDTNVVVTGAGRGLGAALALTLSDSGCNVILSGRSLEALDVVAGHIEARTGRDPKRVVMDLADMDFRSHLE